ncbi:hypothetical protein [Microcystis sp. M42BS1]|uniref:hypothetical protein n=1 Tax=Microcystis sp. M42BS1 TaxID=2771192 RepID=UPI0025891C6F|nr:hypothetical protein [Microcystis sp. M42BS1]MCA2570698.1 hypothetical protein [Microcystis sp. M42BS1]
MINPVEGIVANRTFYKQVTVPERPSIGDLWMDTSLVPPILKKCVGIDPSIFASVEGGGGGGGPNITSGTAAPSGGADGDIYLQYT